MEVNVEVIEGQVKLSQIYFLVDKPDMKVIHVEASSKRFEIMGATAFNPEDTVVEELLLVPVEDSMSLGDSNDGDTWIKIPLGFDTDSRWNVSYGTYARYGFEIIMYKVTEDDQNMEHSILWKSNHS